MIFCQDVILGSFFDFMSEHRRYFRGAFVKLLQYHEIGVVTNLILIVDNYFLLALSIMKKVCIMHLNVE